MVTLRVSGANFDVDAFLQESEVTPAVVFRRGEPRFPGSQPNGPVLDSSGINVGVSDAEFGNLEQQTRETLRFLADNFAMLEGIANYPGVDGLELDFAVTGGDGFVESYRFSPELLEQIGRLRITLCVSRYIPTDGAT
jgi:hypothetical protein